MLRRCVPVWGWVISLIAGCCYVMFHRDAAGTPCVFSERAGTHAEFLAVIMRWGDGGNGHGCCIAMATGRCRALPRPLTGAHAPKLRNSTSGVPGHGVAKHETARQLPAVCVATNIICRGPKLPHMCTRTTPAIPSTKQSRPS